MKQSNRITHEDAPAPCVTYCERYDDPTIRPAITDPPEIRVTQLGDGGGLRVWARGPYGPGVYKHRESVMVDISHEDVAEFLEAIQEIAQTQTTTEQETDMAGTCPDCNGTGRSPNGNGDLCLLCNGFGEYPPPNNLP